jgi:hypothetical protein
MAEYFSDKLEDVIHTSLKEKLNYILRDNRID